MKSIEKYNNLHDTLVTRSQLMKVQNGLYELVNDSIFQPQKDIVNAHDRISKLFEKHPKSREFQISIKRPLKLKKTKGLNGRMNYLGIVKSLKKDNDYVSHEKVVGVFKGKKEANFHIYTTKRYTGTINPWGLQSFSDTKGHGLLVPTTLPKKSKNTVEKRANKATRQKKGAGLNGDLKLAPNLDKKTKIPKGTLSVNDFLEKKFNPIKVKPKWKEIIGDFELPTHILLSGGGGNGKSGMALEFAQDMTDLGYNVLFASPEQFYRPSFGNLLRDVGIRPDNYKLVFSPHYKTDEYNPSMFDLVILDSKDSFSLTDPSDFEKLTKQYPNTSFIVMSQANKDGNFSGSGKWRNVVDTILEAHEPGKMRTGIKNRWNQYGEVTLFNSKNQLEKSSK